MRYEIHRKKRCYTLRADYICVCVCMYLHMFKYDKYMCVIYICIYVYIVCHISVNRVWCLTLALSWVPRKKHISEAKYKKPQSLVPPSLSLSIVTQLVQKTRETGGKKTCSERTVSVRRPPPKAHG